MDLFHLNPTRAVESRYLYEVGHRHLISTVGVVQVVLRRVLLAILASEPLDPRRILCDLLLHVKRLLASFTMRLQVLAAACCVMCAPRLPRVLPIHATQARPPPYIRKTQLRSSY